MPKAGRLPVLLANPLHLVLHRLSQPLVYLANLNKAHLNQMLSVLQQQRPPLDSEPSVNRRLLKLPNRQRVYLVAERSVNLSSSSSSPPNRRTRLEHSDNPPSKINNQLVVYSEEVQRRLVSQNRRGQGLEHLEVERLVHLQPPQTRSVSRSSNSNSNQLLDCSDRLSLLQRTLLVPSVSLPMHIYTHS